MSAKLNTFVHVHNGSESVAFGPNDKVPAWAAEKITNPAVWATPPDAPEPARDQEPKKPDPNSSGGVTVPPQRGPGSSAVAWAEYAKAKGFETDEDAKTAEIITALAEAGIPVE